MSLHVRRRPDGGLSYRIWSGVQQRYVTGVVSKEEAHAILLQARKNATEANFEKYEWPQTVRVAESNGDCSSRHSTLEGPWREEGVNNPAPPASEVT